MATGRSVSDRSLLPELERTRLTERLFERAMRQVLKWRKNVHGFRGSLVAASFAPVLAFGAPAYAADLLDAPETVEPTPVAPNLWSGSLTVYGWCACAYSGDFGVGGLGPVDLGEGDGSTDWLAIINGFFMANGEVRYGRFGLYGDFIYANLGNTVSGPLGFVDADWGFKAIIATGAASFQFVDTATSQLEVLAGVRYWGLDVDLSLELPGGGGPSASANRDLFNPVVGLRGRQALSERFYLEGTGLIGGGTDHIDFMWDAYAGIGYNFTDRISASLGYRGMGVDYESGGVVLDLISHGPVAGVTFRF